MKWIRLYAQKRVKREPLQVKKMNNRAFGMAMVIPARRHLAHSPHPATCPGEPSATASCNAA